MSYTYRRASELGPWDTRRVKLLLEKSGDDLKEVFELLNEAWGKEKTGTGRAVAVSQMSTAYVTVKKLRVDLDGLSHE